VQLLPLLLLFFLGLAVMGLLIGFVFACERV
jgi:hypothetical protein